MAPSDTDDECIHLLASGTCTLCKPPKPWRTVHFYTARFDTRCPLCADPIMPGDHATLQTNGDLDRTVHRTHVDYWEAE